MRYGRGIAFFVIVFGTLLLACWCFGPTVYTAAMYGTVNRFDVRGDAYWKLEFLKRTSPFMPPLHEFVQHDIHPTRGWTPKPKHVLTGNHLETTNGKGHRSTEDYVRRNDKYVIMVLGDSFRFGQGADDTDVWPTLLQAAEPRFQVINLGVCGYGIDQMYITERESIEEYFPQLLILAATTDDPTRSLLSFREYSKPRFILNPQGQLVLTNTPVGPIHGTVAALHGQYGAWSPWRALALENTAFEKSTAEGHYEREWNTLNARLLESVVQCARSHGVDTLFVHLEMAGDVSREPGHHYLPTHTEKLLEECALKDGVPFLQTREPFLNSGKQWVLGHYQGPEARFVAGLIRDKIQDIPSWKRFQDHR